MYTKISDGKCSEKSVLANADLIPWSPPLSSAGSDGGPDRLIPTRDEWVTDIRKPVKIRFGDADGEEERHKWPLISVPTLFKQRVEAFKDKPAMKGMDENGCFREWTFQQYGLDVTACAKGLIALGLQQFGAVCILGQNSPQWAIAAIATIHAGGVVTGIYDTDTAVQCEYIANLMQACIAIVEDEHQAAKFIEVRHHVKSLKMIVQWKGKPSHPDIKTWAELMSAGEQQDDGALQQRLRQMAINTCCMVIFTSGSTGNPKAAMLTHDYCVMTAMTLQKHAGAKLGEEHFISFMPFNHASGSIFELFSSLVSASPMTFAAEALRGDLLEGLQQVRPTQMFAVPRHYEKLATKIRPLLNTSIVEHDNEVIQWAQTVTLDYYRAKINGEPKLEQSEAYLRAKQIFLDDFKRKLGLDRAKYLIVGGAPIHPDLVEFFLGLDIQIFQEYGLSEVGPTNIEHPRCFAPGSVGPVMEGHKVLVENVSTNQLDGEVLFDGRIRFMGYAENVEKTLETVDSMGRVKSGDLGHFDARGRLFITGRIKDLIITSGGKKISPVHIEQELQELLHPAVSSVMVVGEGRKYISALFGLKSICDESTGLPSDTVAPITEEWLKSLGSTKTRISEIIDTKEDPVHSAIQNAIDQYNLKYAQSSVESVKKWLLLPAEFSQAGGELNNILKSKRAVIEAKYKDAIDGLYD